MKHSNYRTLTHFVHHLEPLTAGEPLTCRLLILFTVLAAAGFFYPPVRTAVTKWFISSREALQSAPGFLESTTLIFMCELGDKTFFISALLAMRLGRAAAFCGSVASLGLMTVVSVGLGVVFSHVPQIVDKSASITQYVGAALLAYFGATPVQSMSMYVCMYVCTSP